MLFKCIRRQAIIAFLLTAIPLTAHSQDLVALARSGDLEAVRAALAAMEAVDPATLERPMYFAAQRGHGDVVALLLEHPTLVKRPVFMADGKTLAVGFQERTLTEALDGA